MREIRKREIVEDKYGKKYTVVFLRNKGNPNMPLLGRIYAGNTWMGEFYGTKKEDVMKNISKNIDIIIYD